MTAPGALRTRRPPKPRPSPATRRFGYLVSALVNGALLWLLHVWPGWDVVPFLTEDFTDVLWLVDLSLWVGVGAGLLYFVADPRWLVALGGVATTAVGLAAAVRTWQVFPFDLSDAWTVVFRVGLVLGIVGAAIGILVNAVTFVRALAVGDEDHRR
jgi:hypothetical protein